MFPIFRQNLGFDVEVASLFERLALKSCMSQLKQFPFFNFIILSLEPHCVTWNTFSRH